MDINNAIQIVGQTALSVYSAMPIKIVLLVAALLFCFAGFKLLRGVTALLGVVLGVACGTCIPDLFSSSMTPFMEMIVTILGMVILGIICGVICFKFYQLGIFLVFAVVGICVVYVPALFIAERTMAAFWIILAVGALLFGTTGVLFLRPVSIFVTSCFGFAAAFPMMDLLQSQVGEQPMWVSIVLGAVLSVFGFAVQLLTNRKAAAHPFGREDDDGEADEAEVVSMMPQPDEIDDVSDSTQVLDMRELPQEEPDEIDSISDLIAARIGLAEPETRPLTSDDAQQMTRLMEEPETQPLEQQTRETEPLEQQEEAAQETAVLETDDVQVVRETDAAPAQETVEEKTQPDDEPNEQTQQIPEDDPVIRLLDAMRPQAKRTTVPVMEQTAQPDNESAAVFTEAKTGLDDAPTIGFERVKPVEENDEQTQVFGSVEPSEIGNEPTQLLDETEVSEPEQTPIAPDEQLEEQSTQVLNETGASEIGNEPTQLLDETEVSELEQTPGAPDKSIEEQEELLPRKTKHWNPLRILPALLLAAGALTVATVGFQYVEIVLALGAACYLLKWYRTAAFACAILCVRRAVDAAMLYMRSDGVVLGLNHTTLELGLDIVSCLVLLWLTIVAVHSYTKASQADADEEEY